jgi:hypothetical protein
VPRNAASARADLDLLHASDDLSPTDTSREDDTSRKDSRVLHSILRSSLERKLNIDLLCAVNRKEIVTGVTTGTIPAAATLGMLVGYGARLGAPMRVLHVVGEIVLRGRGQGAGEVVYVATGTILHVVAMLSCGVAYVALLRDAGQHRAAWAIAVAATAVAAVFVAARTFAGSIALVLTPANLIALGVVIALSLPIGMRFAPTRV